MKTIVEIEFHAADLPAAANTILGPCQIEKDIVKIQPLLGDILVKVTLDETDPRVAKVFALLDEYGEERWVRRRDTYTDDELQAAPLLIVIPWQDVLAYGGPGYGTTYDTSQACPRCGTGARQTSPLHIARGDLKQIEKLRMAFTVNRDVLVHDVDVEPLLAAHVTGALFWPVYAKTKAGDIEELRRQQMFIEHVMPPMGPKSALDQTQLCPICRRGCFTHASDSPVRYVYRREDLANIQDVNVTWEWFGECADSPEAALTGAWPHPVVLVTPKVMNLLRAKTKKEAKYQGCGFTPIWIEDSGA